MSSLLKTNRQFFLALMLLATLVLSGCQSASQSGVPRQKLFNLPSWAGLSKTAKPAEKEAKQDEKIEDNPFIASKTGSIPTQTVSNSKEIASSKIPKMNHDAATLMLIESEFRNANQEERAEWFEMLKDIPPERIPQILSVRRLMLDKKKNEPKTSEETLTSIANSKNSSSTLLDYVNDNDSNPLGGDSPWGGSSKGATNNTAKKQISLENSQGAVLMGIDDSAMKNPNLTKTASLNAPSPNPSLKPTQENFQSSGIAKSDLPGAGIPVIPSSTSIKKLVEAKLVSQKNTVVDSTINQSDAWKTELQKLIALSEAEIAQANPGATDEEKLEYVSKQVYLRMLYLMGDQQGRALQAIDKLEPAEQEFWQQTFWAMANYFDTEAIPEASDRATQTINQLSTAIQSLQETARLELRNVNFCSKIDSYGSYDKFDRNEFKPGQPVLIYGELKNFQSEPSAEGMFKTVVKSTIEIYKAGPQGGLIASNKFNPTEDLCRNKRHDYFHSYMINIPERIALGPHVLKLTVEDQLSQKIATYTLKFNVN